MNNETCPECTLDQVHCVVRSGYAEVIGLGRSMVNDMGFGCGSCGHEWGHVCFTDREDPRIIRGLPV